MIEWSRADGRLRTDIFEGISKGGSGGGGINNPQEVETACRFKRVWLVGALCISPGQQGA